MAGDTRNNSFFSGLLNWKDYVRLVVTESTIFVVNVRAILSQAVLSVNFTTLKNRKDEPRGHDFKILIAAYSL